VPPYLAVYSLLQEGKKKMEEKEEDESKRGTATSARLFIELLLDAFPSEQPLHYPPHNMSNFLRILFASAHPEPLKHSIVSSCFSWLLLILFVIGSWGAGRSTIICEIWWGGARSMAARSSWRSTLGASTWMPPTDT